MGDFPLIAIGTRPNPKEIVTTQKKNSIWVTLAYK